MSDTKEESKFRKIFKEYFPYVITIILVILIKKNVVSPIQVNGESMMDTLHDGDIMILNIIKYRFSEIKRFDIVVVRQKKEYIIKRVIGLPGETVEYKDNQLYINHKKVKDSYGRNPTEDFSVVVPEGSYFVLGDNRNNSLDSRYFGCFSEKQILGSTRLTLFPFSRMGIQE